VNHNLFFSLYENHVHKHVTISTNIALLNNTQAKCIGSKFVPDIKYALNENLYFLFKTLLDVSPVTKDESKSKVQCGGRSRGRVG
jgi:hypothetical protein